jgi:RecG-like helicase
MGILRRKDKAAPVADASDPTVLAIAEAPPRQRVRVRGKVTRMRARPSSGLPSLAVTIADDTGTVVAVWTGRRAIGGITLGRKLVLEGVAVRRGNQLEFTNPQYTLLP